MAHHARGQTMLRLRVPVPAGEIDVRGKCNAADNVIVVVVVVLLLPTHV